MSYYLAQGLASGLQRGLDSYNATKREMAAEEERAEEKAWRNEQRAQQRAEWGRQEQLRTGLAAASAPAKVDQGYQITDAAGSDAFTKDADAAAAMQDMVSGQRPTLSSATRVQDKAYADPAQAKKAEAEYNAPASRLDRMGEAAMAVDPSTGLSLKNAAAKAKSDQVEIDKKMKAEADETFNRVLMERVPNSPRWWEDAANMLTETSVGALQNVTIKPVLSADEKTVDLVAVTPDGKERVVKSLPTDAKGHMAFIQQAMKADPVTKLKWLSEQVTRDYEASKQQENHELGLEKIRATGDEARKTAAYRASLGNRGSAGGGSIGREERLRYTSLFQEAGRRQNEAQRTYNTLITGRAYRNAAPGSREYEELQGLRDAIRQYGEERSTYQSLLAEGVSKVGLGNARPQAAAPAAQQSGPVKVSTKAEYDALPKGTRYVAPDGSNRIKQ